jgi:hypothetical protein
MSLRQKFIFLIHPSICTLQQIDGHRRIFGQCDQAFGARVI